MSPEFEEMTSWLLDDNYQRLVKVIAGGRHLSEEAVRALIDRAPFFAAEAQLHGLLDHVAYEDDLAPLLGRRLTSAGRDGGEGTG